MFGTNWTGDNAWYLLNLSKKELMAMFPKHSYEGLRRTRNKVRQRIREGKMEQPSKPEGYNEQIDKIRQLLERSGIDPDEIGQVNKVNVWQGFIKNQEGEIEHTDLYSVQYTPKPTELTEDDFVRQATPTIIRPSKSRPVSRKDKLAIVLPDIQAGFRLYENGNLDPFHDTKAIDIALQIIKDSKPDQVILNGDNLDLAEFGRFAQETTFARTLNPTLDYVHQLLAQIRANSPNSRIVYLAGNHELRLQKYLNQYADKLSGVKQAGRGQSILTVPFLLNLKALEVEYASGYPANKYYINDRLMAIHGHIVRAAGQTAAAVVRANEDSVIFGHVHRHEYAARTAQNHKGARYIIAQSFGCLARIDGAVPSYNNGIDEEGEVVKNYENWQLGMGAVHYREGDNPFSTEQITIDPFDNYSTRFNGKIYSPTN